METVATTANASLGCSAFITSTVAPAAAKLTAMPILPANSMIFVTVKLWNNSKSNHNMQRIVGDTTAAGAKMYPTSL